MFCRISADRVQGGEMRYYSFRLTPYQLTLRDSDAAEPQPCCLLIAERVHSGYEGIGKLSFDVLTQGGTTTNTSKPRPLLDRLKF